MNIDKKKLTVLYNINQDLKTVFNTYAMINEDTYDRNIVCISNKSDYVVRTGEHYALCSNSPISEFILTDISINSARLFKFFSKYKKYTTGINISDEKLSFEYSCEDKIEIEFTNQFGDTIGELQKSNLISTCPFFTQNHKNVIENFIPMIIVSEEEVVSLVKNSYMFLNYDKYSVRITRELIPGLKKNHNVSVMFRDLPDNNIFECIIKAERSNTITYHIYKCLFI